MFINCTDFGSVLMEAQPGVKKCGYCRAGKKSRRSVRLVPKGFCANAFYGAYPYLLGLLYDANFRNKLFTDELIIRCPNQINPASVRVISRFKKTKIISNLIENISRAIGFPKDALDKLVTFEVVSAAGHCRLKSGDLFKINIPDINSTCPAAFFSMYPLLGMYLHSTEKKSRQIVGDRLNFLCPDPKTNIIYDVNFVGQCSPGNLRIVKKPCDYLPDMSRYKIVVSANSDCSMRSWLEEEISLDRLIPSGICPFVLNIAIPYILTLSSGGHFKWCKDINTVEAQCPCCQGQVAFIIRRDKSDFKKLSLIFSKIGGSCPNNHQQGQSYYFDFAKIICLDLFVRIFPLVLKLECGCDEKELNNGLIITCPFKEKAAAYILKMSPKN